MELTEFLALYAAIVSTGMLGWSVYQSRASYKVEVNHALYDVREEAKGGIAIKALNHSPQAVHLQGFLLIAGNEKTNLLKKGNHIFPVRNMHILGAVEYASLEKYSVDDQCPITLGSGESHIVNIPLEALIEIRKLTNTSKLFACVQDQLGKKIYSKAFDYWDNSGEFN